MLKSLAEFLYEFYLKLDRRFILLMFFLNLPAALITLNVTKIEFNDIRHLFLYVFYVLFFSMLTATAIFFIGKINGRAEKFFKYILLTICGIIFLTDIFTIVHYGTTLNHTMLRIILGTNAKEASNFFSDYVLDGYFLTVCAMAIVIFLALCKIKLLNLNKKFVAGFLILSSIIFLSRIIQNPERVFEKSNSITRIAVLLPEVFLDIEDYKKLFEAAQNEVHLTRNESDLPLVVFILGEATTKNHMQLYGYHLPTNPKLNERNLNGELKIFSDTISPNSYTMAVMQKVFTFIRNENSGENDNSKMHKGNLISILNAAGYSTVWMSNKEMGGLFGNMNRIYAEAANKSKFTQYRDDSENNTKLDEQLLPFLEEELQNKHEKDFYVLHLMGTHNTYKSRYPSNFEVFTAADETNPRKEVRQTCAEYDNAVLYNDFIVDEIIKRVENLDAVVIYISDHGEDVFEERDFADHVEAALSRSMLEIPFIVWTSQKFREKRPELEEKIKSATNKPFMTDDMIHFFMDIMKIETADFDETLSPVSPNYNSSRMRIVGDGKIYTKEKGIAD